MWLVILRHSIELNIQIDQHAEVPKTSKTTGSWVVPGVAAVAATSCTSGEFRDDVFKQ